MTYRLLEVICTAVLVSEDLHGNLVKHIANPEAIPAAEWPTYATDRFARQLAALEQQPDTLDALDALERSP